MSRDDTPDQRPVRVAIVVHDDISRRGMCSLLTETGQVEIIASTTHAAALTGQVDWPSADIAVVAADDEHQPEDHYPGVAVVEHIHHACPGPRPTIVVLTDHYFDDALRRRMREARADFFHRRSTLDNGAAFRDAVLHHRHTHPGVPTDLDTETQFRHGVTEYTRVNRAVAYALVLQRHLWWVAAGAVVADSCLVLSASSPA